MGLKMKRLFKIVGIFALLLLIACAASNKNLPSVSSPDEQEVLILMQEYYKYFYNLDYKGISEWYTPNALIGYKKPVTPLGLEEEKKDVFSRYRRNHVRYKITIQKIETLPYGIVVKSEHKIYLEYRTVANDRYFTWVKTDNGWKIIRHSPYHPNGPDVENSPLNNLSGRKLILSN